MKETSAAEAQRQTSQLEALNKRLSQEQRAFEDRSWPSMHMSDVKGILKLTISSNPYMVLSTLT